MENHMSPGLSVIPSADFQIMRRGKPISLSSRSVFAGKSVALFGLPGAFTPACHHIHLPGIIAEYERYHESGIDLVACTAVNDVFVLDAWRQALGISDEILILADGNGDFARGLGLSFDGRALGLGERSKRYAMWVNDGVIQHLTVEADPTLADVSTAYTLLQVFERWSKGEAVASTYG
jgi:glutaredoxin/glutathione-dependent peroxiredoxin